MDNTMETVKEIRERIQTWQSERQELLEIRDLLNAELDGLKAPRKRAKRGPGRPKGSKNATTAAKLKAAGALPVSDTGISQGRKGQKGRAVARPETALD
jgi:hypothetical protein